MFSALATAVGPTLGAALIEGPGWRWVFFVNIPVGLATFLLGRRVLAESRDEHAKSGADIGGVALITLAMAALALGIVEGGEWGWSSPGVVGAFAATALLVPAFVWRGLRNPSPVVDLRLFRVRSFAVANSVMVLYASAFFAMLLSMVLFLTSVWHYSVMRAGLAITPSPIAAALIAPLAGRMVARVGFRPVIMIGLITTGLSIASLAVRTTSTPEYAAVWLPASVLAGLGVGSCFSLISGAAVSSLEPSQFGVGSAVNQTARQIGSIVGVATLIAVLGSPTSAAEALTSFHNAWWMVAGLTGAAALTATALGGRARKAALAAAEAPADAPFEVLADAAS